MLANSSREPEHEHEYFRDGLVELGWNLVAEFDLGKRAREHLVLLDRDIVSLGDFDNFRANGSLALCDNAGRALFVIVQRDRELVSYLHAHKARSTKCPARAGDCAGGTPSRMTISPGSNSALPSAWLSCAAPARNCAAVAGRSAQRRTDVRSPLSDTSA